MKRGTSVLSEVFRHALAVGAMAPIAACGSTVATSGDGSVTVDVQGSTDGHVVVEHDSHVVQPADANVVIGNDANVMDPVDVRVVIGSDVTVMDPPDANVTIEVDANAVDVAVPIEAAVDAGVCAAQPVTLGCREEIYYPCGLPAGSVDSTGAITTEGCRNVVCHNGPGFCSMVGRDEAGQGETWSCITCGTGRRPAGFVSGTYDGDALASFFAHVTELEAASVPAFETLALELALHGAPSSLVQRARDAADDERRHARATGALATRYGATVRAPVIEAGALRSLEAMATDNVVEGCVRETFGALFASWQAAHAGDECVKRAMGPIAQDETRHADLSWAIAAWADGVMDASARVRVARARDEAVRALCESIASSAPSSALVERAGVPARESAVRMAGVLRSELWG